MNRLTHLTCFLIPKSGVSGVFLPDRLRNGGTRVDNGVQLPIPIYRGGDESPNYRSKTPPIRSESSKIEIGMEALIVQLRKSYLI